MPEGQMDIIDIDIIDIDIIDIGIIDIGIIDMTLIIDNIDTTTVRGSGRSRTLASTFVGLC